MRQERFSPSTNVSGWKGRQDYLKGYPGAAMSDALNGGFAGGSSYVLEDSYKFFSKTYWSGNLYLTNIPQTHNHLRIDLTGQQQSTYWAGAPSFYIPNQPSSTNTYSSDFAYSTSMYMFKGWSTGIGGATNLNNNQPGFRPMYGYSNWSYWSTIEIYNYSANEFLKPFKFWSQFNNGNNSSYASWCESQGYLRQSNTVAGPAVTSLRSYDSYQSGSNNYQQANVYGFGGLRA